LAGHEAGEDVFSGNALDVDTNGREEFEEHGGEDALVILGVGHADVEIARHDLVNKGCEAPESGLFRQAMGEKEGYDEVHRLHIPDAWAVRSEGGKHASQLLSALGTRLHALICRKCPRQILLDLLRRVLRLPRQLQ